MFDSVRNVLNGFWGQFSKVSFMGGNYPLSVTVVNNSISHDLFKNLTSKRELLNADNVYIHNDEIKESLNIVENIHNNICNEKKFCTSKIFENTKDSKNKNAEKSDENKLDINKDVKYNTTDCNYLVSVQNSNVESDEEFEYIYSDTNTKEVDVKVNGYIFEETYNKDISNTKQLFNCNNSMGDKTVNMENSLLTHSTNTLSTETIQQSTFSNLFTNMFQKIIDGVTDKFSKTDFNKSNMPVKASFSSKQRRKLTTVAKGRGRGRAKSQLRRSGVSQTRHRKERIKHDIIIDIESDFKSWQELEEYDTTEDKESEDLCLGEDVVDAVQYIIEERMSPVTYTFADVEPKIKKPKIRRNVNYDISKFSAKIPEYLKQTDTSNYDFRPRLISESSIDSEDSYCIVFETDSEVTFKSDSEGSDINEISEESDINEISEDEITYKDEKLVAPIREVKFNLNPVVHLMVQWDYAYRAARKGPWEEMARDRERFRGRINCIERVLNPILTVQHRIHIWQERFALTK
ncbi:Protein phosphatase 1 regulatory subunit 15A [Melipona quadrifasciata]|uniref:Protein phosphatase 1 regulatory subunit 15A n=1 Tax=Melipona quadrifasciata TaxID=166423 RepID=A0A0M9A061_9HYME|nr:Protein phosphatase 1 regulatory subunit 15A [Melipona quadrifasciata]